jgi:hypothetical protein
MKLLAIPLSESPFGQLTFFSLHAGLAMAEACPLGLSDAIAFIIRLRLGS